MDSQFRIEMLGKFSVGQGSREITRFRTRKAAALLAYLAFFPNRSQTREHLVQLFWPQSESEAARVNLSVALNSLRRQLEPPGVPAGAVLVADRAHVSLNPLAFTTDVEDFERALSEAKTADPQSLTLWARAADLYTGDLMPGYYEDWILAERDRLREDYRSALRAVTKAYVETAQFERAIAYAHRTLQTDPLREGAYRDLMRLYQQVGRPEEALSQYQELERRLKQSLQVKPSPATRELAEQIRASIGGSAQGKEKRAESKPTPGKRGPKSDQPAAEPPLPSEERPPYSIPLQFTRFYGREEAMRWLKEVLGGKEPGPPQTQEQAAPLQSSPRPATDLRHTASIARLITLTGPGGTGKTRLSIEVAGQVLAAFPGGLWFVPLADVHEPLRIGEAVRDALGLPRQSQSPALDQVVAFLESVGQPALLILDNFEQVTEGGASVVWTLLNRVPLLRCLVTSRRPLALPGEQEYPLPPLPVPLRDEGASASSLRPMQLMTYPSVSLFVDRAQAVRPEFQITPRNAEAIATLCEQLEGIPLAIELAAARAKTLTPDQMVARLAERFELLSTRRVDKPERHRSLWAAIEWSYHLLSPELQRFFARLSVFRGGWSLEAAEQVCGETSALNFLTQLQGHSLLTDSENPDEIRFGMLETLREFAAEQMTEEERGETGRRHAAYFHQMVMGADLSGAVQQRWYDRFETELDNIRAALEWSLGAGNDIEIGLDIAGELIVFWRVRGRIPEGRRWYGRLLDSPVEAPSVALSRTLYGAGALDSLVGEFVSARSLLERCLQVSLALDDRPGIVIVQNELGTIAYRHGDFDQAAQYFRRYLEMARKEGHRLREAGALTNLASIAQATGDFAASRALHTESLEIWRALGDRIGEARTLHNLANLARTEGALEEARASFTQSVAIKRELIEHQSIRDDYGISSSLLGLAEVTLSQGDNAAAAAYARESLALARKQNAHTLLIELLHFLIYLAQAEGEAEIGARMIGALEREREEKNYPIAPVDKPEYERILADLQASLGKQAFARVQQEGRNLSLEQALSALDEALHPV